MWIQAQCTGRLPFSFSGEGTAAGYWLNTGEMHRADVTISYQDGEQIVLLNGENVNGLLRTEEGGKHGLNSSAVPAVGTGCAVFSRSWLPMRMWLWTAAISEPACSLTRTWKYSLTADSAVRARRRFEELAAKGRRSRLKKSKRISLKGMPGTGTGRYRH